MVNNFQSRVRRPGTDNKGRAIYCALFFVSWAFCWSNFSSAAFGGTSLTVSFSILPEGWLVVLVLHALTAIHTDIEGLVDCLDERGDVRNLLAGDFLTIHR